MQFQVYLNMKKSYFWDNPILKIELVTEKMNKIIIGIKELYEDYIGNVICDEFQGYMVIFT